MSTAKTLASIAAPAPEVIDEPQVQPKHESKRQKALLDAGLAETRVERVRVDGLVRGELLWTRDGRAEGEEGGQTAMERIPFFGWTRYTRLAGAC